MLWKSIRDPSEEGCVCFTALNVVGVLNWCEAGALAHLTVLAALGSYLTLKLVNLAQR